MSDAAEIDKVIDQIMKDLQQVMGWYDEEKEAKEEAEDESVS